MKKSKTPLAERPLLGYPGAEAKLYVNGDNYTVTVGHMTFGPTESRAIAKDWYFHPFCYGYEYQREDDDSVLDSSPSTSDSRDIGSTEPSGVT